MNATEALGRIRRSGRLSPTVWAAGLAALALLFVSALLWRSPAMALGLAAAAAAGALLLFFNPPFSRVSFWILVAAIVAAIPAGNLRPPGLPGMFMAWRLLLALFFGVLVVRLALRDRLALARLSGPAVLWLPIAAWSLLTVLWARDVLMALRYCAFLGVGVFLIFAIRQYAREPSRFRTMLLASIVTAAMVIGYGVFERITRHRLPESAMRELPARYGWMVTSVFHNTNEFATYMALWLPLFATALFAARSMLVRLASAGVCVMGAYCLLCTGSRGNILAVALAGVVLIALGSARWPLRLAPILALAVIGGLYGLHAFTGAVTKHQLGALQMRTVMTEGTHARGDLLRDGLSLLGGTGGAGVGAGNVEGYMADRGYDIQNVHNWWLELLVNLGVISFVCYLWFYFAVTARLYRVSRASSDRFLRLAATGLLAGWVGFSIGCISSSSLIAWAPMWIYFGLCIGLLEAAWAVDKDRRDAPPDHLPSLPQPS